MCLVVAGLIGWAGLTIAIFALALPPLTTLLPLLILSATYESVLALHVGVERIGRYLLVAHEDAWERAAGRFGRPPGGLATDPLFAVIFLLAAVLTPMPLIPVGPIPQELAIVGGAAAAFIVRVLVTRAGARRQRDVDTARFQDLKPQP